MSSSRDEQIVNQLITSIREKKLQDLPLLWADEYPSTSTHPFDLGYEGRHRMTALKELQGDEPVLLNLTRGDRFNLTDSPYYSQPVREYVAPSQVSPLELLKQQLMFGDSPVTLDPLWVGE